MAIRKQLPAADPSNTDWQRDLCVSYSKLGDLQVAEGKLPDARKYYEDALAVAKQLAATDPSYAESRSVLAAVENELGVAALVPAPRLRKVAVSDRARL